MSVELRWLIYNALLAATIWAPLVIGVNLSEFEGKSEMFGRPPDMSKAPPWVHRSFRAQQNLIEQFAPFAAVVLACAVAGVSTPVTRTCVIVFFWLRVAHAVGMISGLARFPVRPIIYLGGWAATLIVAWQALTYAGAK